MNYVSKKVQGTCFMDRNLEGGLNTKEKKKILN